jgi:lipoate-protein ligase A
VNGTLPRRTTVGRLLQDGARPGAENMARDEALLELQRIPTLRFYRWTRPTLSLGYFQAAAQLPLQQLRESGCDIVRRSTGGKAILHQSELTYALCLPESGALGGGPAAAMGVIHAALAAELQRQATDHGATATVIEPRAATRLLSDRPDSAWCFEDSSPLDLVLERRKLVGSAARRRQGWVLFHGSLVVQRPRTNPGIAELGFEPDAEALGLAFGSALGYDFQPGAWSAEELAAAAAIATDKFGDDEFTSRR